MFSNLKSNGKNVAKNKKVCNTLSVFGFIYEFTNSLVNN